MNWLINWISQVAAVTRFSLQTIPQRLGSAGSALFGIAGVVAVMVGVLSIAEGFLQAMMQTGSPANAIVLRSGSDSEMTSGLSREETKIISDAPGVARSDGTALASAELFVVINLPKRNTGTDANVPLRGVEPAAFQVREEVQVVAGRRFQSGRNEIMVGTGAAQELAGLEVGQRIQVGTLSWEVVGLFSAQGGLAESEIWTDAGVLQPAYRRGDTYQAVYVKLTSAEAFQAFKDALTTDPRLNVKVMRQTEYYAEQSQLVYKIITGLGTLVALLMGVGAIFGALNTMYSSVSARTHEIATLRALGFRGPPLVLSVLLESLLLAFIGGAVGAGLAYLAFDGFRAATLNWQTFSQVTFAFAVTPRLLVQGVIYSAVIGTIGGFFPALRAARIPVATALREG
jgi:putative ABC transport system permease protein